MFLLIILLLVVDTIMLGVFAVKCNPSNWDYLVPMYAVQIVGYGALYRIYIKMNSGKKEKLEDKLTRLREENETLKKQVVERGECPPPN